MASGTIPFEYYPYYRSISSNENLNDYKNPGVYRWTNAPTNAPTYGIGTAWLNAQMEVRRDNELVTQVVMYNPGSNLIMPNVKRALSNGTWGPWYPIRDNSSFSGVFDASKAASAYPIGVTIEYGSNIPIGYYGMVITFKATDSRVTQFAVQRQSDYQDIYIRNTNGSAWTNWVKYSGIIQT